MLAAAWHWLQGTTQQYFASTSWLTSCSYDLALIGGALGHIRAEFHLSEVMVQVVVGSAKIGAVFGEHTLRCTARQHACRRLLSPFCRALHAALQAPFLAGL